MWCSGSLLGEVPLCGGVKGVKAQPSLAGLLGQSRVSLDERSTGTRLESHQHGCQQEGGHQRPQLVWMEVRK